MTDGAHAPDFSKPCAPPDTGGALWFHVPPSAPPLGSPAALTASQRDRTGDIGRDLGAGLPEALGVPSVDVHRDIAARAKACRFAAREHPLATLQDRRHLVGPESGPAAGMHAWRAREGERRHHAARTRRTDHAAGMQDVGEDPVRAAQRPGQRIGDGAEDEASGGELRQIGDQRGDQIAELQLAGLHELADGVLGALKRAHQRIADIAADLARLGGVIG